MWNAGLEELQAGINIARKNISNLRYADDTTLMAESKEELKSLLTVKEESEKAGLKFNIQNWFPLVFTELFSLLSKGTQESYPTPQFKKINYSALSFLYDPILTSILTTGKAIALTRQTFFG